MIKNAIIIFLLPLCFVGCKKFVEIGSPQTQLSENNTFSNDQTAISVLTGIYANQAMGSGIFTGQNSLSLIGGLSADEFNVFSGISSGLQQTFQNKLDESIRNTGALGSGALACWASGYESIIKCNAAIEGLNNSATLTDNVKRQLLGEAKFVRAFFYFYLTNLYGDVPLILTTDYVINSTISRSSKAEVYAQIINDLKEAKQLLSDQFLDGDLQAFSVAPERVRPTTWAASALLARVFLYDQNFTNAEAEASRVIDNSIFNLSSLNNSFLKASLGNNEAIWQLQPVLPNFNTPEGPTFLITSDGPRIWLSNELLNSFEPNDQRRFNRNWIDSLEVSGTTYYFPYKYKIKSSPEVTNETGSAAMSEFVMVLRLSEQYLIRAEARAAENNIAGAQNDINIVRTRAGLPNTTASDSESLIAAIQHERQTELFSEWGHRWLDLKRTGKIDEVMSIVTPQKGGTWETRDQLYPIPVSEIQLNPNMTQTPGY